MTGGDKILAHIKSDCDDNIKSIEVEAENICAQIMADGRKKAEAAAEEIAGKAKINAEHIKAAAKSRADLEMRNTLLKKRRGEIDKTFNAVLKYLLNLEDEAYFKTIYKLAKRLDGKSGEIVMNLKDLSRLPSDFKSQMRQSGVDVSVSETPAEISGGFILKCGDIEENMDFSAILDDKRDEIEDLINRELFSE